MASPLLSSRQGRAAYGPQSHREHSVPRARLPRGGLAQLVSKFEVLDAMSGPEERPSARLESHSSAPQHYASSLAVSSSASEEPAAARGTSHQHLRPVHISTSNLPRHAAGQSRDWAAVSMMERSRQVSPRHLVSQSPSPELLHPALRPAPLHLSTSSSLPPRQTPDAASRDSTTSGQSVHNPQRQKSVADRRKMFEASVENTNASGQSKTIISTRGLRSYMC